MKQKVGKEEEVKGMEPSHSHHHKMIKHHLAELSKMAKHGHKHMDKMAPKKHKEK